MPVVSALEGFFYLPSITQLSRWHPFFILFLGRETKSSKFSNSNVSNTWNDELYIILYELARAVWGGQWATTQGIFQQAVFVT
jgi:hypothetical protein